MLLWLFACNGTTPSNSDSATTSSSHSDTSAPGVASCAGSTPILLESGGPSGFEQCPDGTIQRVTVVAAGLREPTDRCGYTYDYLSCTADSDCTAEPNGMCLGAPSDGVACECVYACASDADCGTGEICAPPEVFRSKSVAQCIPATCASNADCASGECGFGASVAGCGTKAELVCREPGDACRLNEDCDTGYCFAYQGEWVCDLGCDY
jgi:Cys-rich repeat protein